MSRRKSLSSAIAILLVASSISVSAASKDEPIMLVVPSRYTLVQFAFDIARIHPATLVSYDSQSNPKTPVMHIWSREKQDWMRLQIEDYRVGDMAGSDAKHVYLVGGTADLPAAITAGSSWASDVVRIETLSLVNFVNRLNEVIRFTPNEWKWLAKRHRLKIRDRNAELRRYGKYGPPGGSKARPRLLETDGPGPLPGEPDVLSPVKQDPAVETYSIPAEPPRVAPKATPALLTEEERRVIEGPTLEEKGLTLRDLEEMAERAERKTGKPQTNVLIEEKGAPPTSAIQIEDNITVLDDIDPADK